MESLNHPLILVLFGVIVGVFSGVMGLGGGSVMIPIMVLAFGLSQTKAHGTSLAVMIPPVTLPAVMEYARNGNVDWRMALWMALGVLLGSFFGALLANSLPKDTLRLVFGFILIYVASYTIFKSPDLGRTTFLAILVLVSAFAIFSVARIYDRQTKAGDGPSDRPPQKALSK